MGWMSRFLAKVAFLAFGVLFSPETFDPSKNFRIKIRKWVFVEVVNLSEACSSLEFRYSMGCCFLGYLHWQNYHVQGSAETSAWKSTEQDFQAYFSLVGVCCAISVA
ncbi:hypothetical protein NE237_025771 [Protea cynaroides]|uniref:Secreted protein n=1 Tax=Protea cynaroides TaxID=273540 RepID=A0A9Q0H5T3_9MAGN|nr:hypothetical protein NE237_025771 [Protea cynaroides]